jgi:adenylate kinase
LAGRLVCPICNATYHVETQPPRIPGECDCDAAALVRRPDDMPEAIETRLAVYARQTQPLVDHYGRQGKLIGVDASDSPGEVFRRTLRLLRSRAAESQSA